MPEMGKRTLACEAITFPRDIRQVRAGQVCCYWGAFVNPAIGGHREVTGDHNV
jgi:hypothetical protein